MTAIRQPVDYYFRSNALSEEKLHFISSETAQKIELLADLFADGTFDLNADEIIRWLNITLPTKKMHQDTLKMRVEGYSHFVNQLWNNAVKMCEYDRDDISHKAGIKPANYYPYHVGSSVPVDEFVTRQDFFKDPVIAMAKLVDDVRGLANLIIELK